MGVTVLELELPDCDTLRGEDIGGLRVLHAPTGRREQPVDLRAGLLLATHHPPVAYFNTTSDLQGNLLSASGRYL